MNESLYCLPRPGWASRLILGASRPTPLSLGHLCLCGWRVKTYRHERLFQTPFPLKELSPYPHPVGSGLHHLLYPRWVGTESVRSEFPIGSSLDDRLFLLVTLTWCPTLLPYSIFLMTQLSHNPQTQPEGNGQTRHWICISRQPLKVLCRGISHDVEKSLWYHIKGKRGFQNQTHSMKHIEKQYI